MPLFVYFLLRGNQMAFTFEKSKNSKLKVILSVDRSIGNKEAYEKYISSFKDGDGDETLLELKEGELPTRFVFRRNLTFETKQAIRSKNFTYETKKGSSGGLNIDINYSTDLIRMALIDIENPPGVEKVLKFKNDNDNYCSKEIINLLDENNVISDLISAYSNATGKQEDKDEEEKNF